MITRLRTDVNTLGSTVGCFLCLDEKLTILLLLLYSMGEMAQQYSFPVSVALVYVEELSRKSVQLHKQCS